MAPKVSASAKAAQPKKGKKVESSSESSSDSSSSDSESEEEPPKKQTVVAKGKAAPAKAAVSSSESSSDSSSEDEAPKKAAPAKSNGVAKKAAASSSDSSSDSEEDSESSSSSSDESEGDAAPATPAVTGKKHGRDEGTSSTPKRVQEEGIPVFVGFSQQMDEAAIRKFFNGYEINSVEFPATSAVVRFAQFDNARAVANLNGRETDKVHVTATLFPRQRDFGGDSAPSTPSFSGQGGQSTTVFVGNLSFDADEDSLRQHFSAAGEVVNVRIAMDRETGRPRGFGHVEFASVEDANKAVSELNGSDLGGRALRVDNESNKTPGSAGRGGRGGDRGRGFGGGFGGRGGDRGRGFGGRGGDRGRGFGGRGGDRGRGRGGSGFGGFEGKKITF